MNCKLCTFKNYCSVSCNITSKENRYIDENGCWITKKKKPEVYFDGINRPIKTASWIYIKKEPYDGSFKIKNNCKNVKCYNPDHLEQKPLKNTICQYCSVILSSDNTKVTKAGSLYPYCRKCYYERTRKKKIKVFCNHCKKPLERLTVKYCNKECYFKNYITIDSTTGCWKWKGPVRNNHPTFSVKGSTMRSSRKWSLLIFGNYSQQDLNHLPVVKCKLTYSCVNYNHLVKKIADEDIQSIKLLRDHKWTYADLEKKYNIHQETIRVAINKEYRKDLNTDIATYLICQQCNKTHDNLGAKFCSQECMNLYILS